MRTRWKSGLSSLTDVKIRGTKCCKVGKCFYIVNTECLRTRLAFVLQSTAKELKRILFSMKSSEGSFLFDGHHVCSTFIMKAFRFSRDMQYSVRAGNASHDGEEQVSANYLGPSTTNSVYKASPGRDAIVSVLERLADDTGEKMLDREERHIICQKGMIPFSRKREVYEHFVREYSQLHDGFPPTKDCFSSTWKRLPKY